MVSVIEFLYILGFGTVYASYGLQRLSAHDRYPSIFRTGHLISKGFDIFSRHKNRRH